MNFNQLRYIIAVNRHRNFSKAADECGIAQSTLSKEIQKLEKEFGVMIFDRSRFPVVPTMKGVELIGQAGQIIRAYDQFAAIAEKHDNEPSGEFRLGILPGLAPYLLPLFIPKITDKYLSLNLKVFEMSEATMEEFFQDDKLDASLTIAPFSKQGFYEDALFEEEFVLYINASHPLAEKPVVKWSEIPIDELILQEDIKSFLINENSLKSGGSISTKINNVAYESGSLETIRKIIDVNGGLTLLPHLSTLYMGGRRLRMVRKIESPTPKRTIIMVTPRGFEKKRITKVIRQEIISSLPQQPQEALLGH